jgi:hypothetical protein
MRGEDPRPSAGDEWCARARMGSLLGQARATVHSKAPLVIGAYLPLDH